MLTHWLHNIGQDNVLRMLQSLDFRNAAEDNVKIIFVPCYLNGTDGIFNAPYYDIILGNDLCVYPSYYEPWGYTPLEAIAFGIPCITTDLAGFGLWANTQMARPGIESGVKVIHRTDYNYHDVADEIQSTIVQYASLTKPEVETARRNAKALSKKALWTRFITYYATAYDFALRRAEERNKNTKS